MELIDKAEVVAELEKLYNLEYDNVSNLSCGKKIMLRHILLFLDTLEVKEVDLNKENKNLKMLLDVIDYSFLQTDGSYDKSLTYPVIDKVLFIKKKYNLRKIVMKHLIDKDALAAEIERLKSTYSDDENIHHVARYNLLVDILSFLDTLEVKEVNLKKDEDKLDKAIKLADAMYDAAQRLTTDASKLHKAMQDWWNFKNNKL